MKKTLIAISTAAVASSFLLTACGEIDSIGSGTHVITTEHYGLFYAKKAVVGCTWSITDKNGKLAFTKKYKKSEPPPVIQFGTGTKGSKFKTNPSCGTWTR